MGNDMTRGSLARSLILFCIPLLLSSLLQELFGWADSLIVGNSVGEGALAAIGASSSLVRFFTNAIIGFTSGVTILVASYFGRGENERQRHILSTFFLAVVGATLVICALVIVFVEPVLGLLRVPADIFAATLEYARIILLGVPFLAVYNTQAAVLRGVGDSRSPLFAVAISVVANVGLDLLFMRVLDWGAPGAAVATVISQALMATFLVAYAMKTHPEFRPHPGEPRFHGKLFAEGAALAFPITIQSLVVSAGNLLLSSFMNGFGSATVAAVTTAYTIDGLIMLPLQSLGTGVATAVSQNEGAREYGRADACIGLGLGIGVVFAALPALIVRTFGEQLIGLFGVSAEVAQIGGNFFRVLSMFYVLSGVAGALRGYVEGRGWAGYSGTCGILTLGVRIACSYLLVGVFDNMVIAYAEGFSWIFQVLFLSAGVLLLRKSRISDRV